MTYRKPPFCNLIQFVKQRPKVENGEKKVTRQIRSSELGNDVKNFYETLINEGTTSHRNATASDPVCKQGKRKLKSPYSSSKTKNEPFHVCVPDDFDKKRGFSEGEKAVCSNASESNSHTSSDECKSSTQVSFKKQSQHLKLLHVAQMGQLDQVSELLSKGADINYQDFYGWTPLMCAAKEGHDKVIKYLLQCGSDHTLRSFEGQTASLLAKMSGHEHIVKQISHFSQGYRASDESNITSDGVERESGTYFCRICKSEFLVSEQKSHWTSTVHLFNSGHKPKGVSYLIPETNKGFQMLLKTGWEVDKGLGPNGEGPKYPVKTVLKHDRKGIGCDVCVKKKAKITHFNPNDKTAIADLNKLPQRTITARKAAQYASKAKERKDRQLERHLRFELSCAQL